MKIAYNEFCECLHVHITKVDIKSVLLQIRDNMYVYMYISMHKLYVLVKEHYILYKHACYDVQAQHLQWALWTANSKQTHEGMQCNMLCCMWLDFMTQRTRVIKHSVCTIYHIPSLILLTPYKWSSTNPTSVEPIHWRLPTNFGSLSPIATNA